MTIFGREREKNGSQTLDENNNVSKPADLPEVPENRKCTTNWSLMVLLVLLLFLLFFGLIISRGTDLNQFIYGHDQCGNTCGTKNVQRKGLNCSGKDMTDKPIILQRYQKINPFCPFSKVKILPTKCVRNCTYPNQLIFHRCYPPNNARLTKDATYMKFLMEVLNVLDQNLYIIFLLSMGGIVLSLAMFLCLRCHVAITFWILSSFQLIVFPLATLYLWRQYLTHEESTITYLFAAVSASSYVIFLLFYMVCLHGSYSLMFELYAETMKAVFRMPKLLIQPILTLFLLVSTIAAMTFFIFFVSSNKFLKSRTEHYITFQYVSHLPMAGYIIFVIFVMMWTYAFIEGCHTMIISGAVSNYYFTRHKKELRSPVYQSLLKTLQHLGIVATGSLIVTLFIFMRSFAEYIVNKAYIQTARHGTPFYTSLVSAIKVIRNNLTNTLKITGFNYIVTNGFSFQAMLLIMLMGIWLNSECHLSFYMWVGFIFGAVCTCLVTLFMMSLITVASETMFFCFCEDQVSNDGNNLPYYMNERLKHLMEKNKEETDSYRLSQI